MLETLLSLGFIALFCVIGWSASADPESLILGGISVATLGFGYGIPTAIVYHWMLRRSLLRIGRLPARWWLQPTALHDRIPGEDRTGVFFWGAVGGSGFLVIVLGIVLTSIGLWRTLFG